MPYMVGCTLYNECKVSEAGRAPPATAVPTLPNSSAAGPPDQKTSGAAGAVQRHRFAAGTP